jgi:hypothetical protein
MADKATTKRIWSSASMLMICPHPMEKYKEKSSIIFTNSLSKNTPR